MTTPNRIVRRATRNALPLGLAIVAALSFSPALAQDAAAEASATAEATPRTGAWSLRRGPAGGFAMHGARVGPRGAIGDRIGAAARHLRERADGEGGDPRGAAFARWLEADADAGPIVPGLVGRLADGTTVRLAFFAGAPEEDGAELAALTFVVGEGDASAFREAVRTAAQGATHVVVDVLGRVVALPDGAPADAAE